MSVQPCYNPIEKHSTLVPFVPLAAGMKAAPGCKANSF
jgi:hypothetical protein